MALNNVPPEERVVMRRPSYIGQRTAWCFTINNPRDDPQILVTDLTTNPRVRYFIFQLEKGVETNTPHFQGYIEFGRSVRFSVVTRDVFHGLAHVEARRGSREQARNYCMKDEGKSSVIFFDCCLGF